MAHRTDWRDGRRFRRAGRPRAGAGEAESRGTAGSRELKESIEKTRADYERWLDARYAAARGHVDALIDPLETRRVLAFALEVGMIARNRQHLVLETWPAL